MTTYRLLYATPSPYSCKVRMAAAHAGIALELVPTETGKLPPELMKANPLAKIPVLLVDGGDAVYDSSVIVSYIDRISGGQLFPKDGAARTRAEVMEAMADGLCDALLAHIYERRYRPEAIVHQPWLDKQWERATRALAYLESSPPSLDEIDAGKIAVRVALGYATLRFAGKWESGCPALLAWAREFDDRHLRLRECLPQ